MMKKLNIDSRVGLYGSKKEIDQTEELITSHLPELPQLDEPKARLAIQQIIDNKKLKADILFSGNTVWSFDRIIRDVKKVQKNGMTAMSRYLYGFLHLSAGSIAHYSLSGWVETYPTVEHLRRFFINNEFGERVLHHLPRWKTDAIRIVESIEHILGI
jgi:hypothetical protein